MLVVVIVALLSSGCSWTATEWDTFARVVGIGAYSRTPDPLASDSITCVRTSNVTRCEEN